uniref:Solute carrier family 22 member 31 n=1 Tax=Cyanoderma ruficeps TaxID=181631 RepID=A0A8C3NVZ4_9PASS
MALGGSRPRGRRAAGGWAPCAALALGWALGWALGAEPPHRCRPDTALLPPPLRRLGGPALLRAAVPRLRGGWSPCQLYRYPHGDPRPNGTGPCTRGWHYALPAAGLRANIVTQWDLVCASRWKVPLEQTTHLLGWTLGSVTAGLACDRFGRRPTFLLSLALAVPVGLGVALAVNFLMVLVARLLFGAALAGAFLTLYVARLELCDPPHRLGVTMVAGFFWIAGELLLPGLALLCRDWRVLQGAVTMILALLAACWWQVGRSVLERGQAHGEPRDLTPVPQVPGTAAGVAALAAGHTATGEGQEDPAGAGRRQLPPGQPPRGAGGPARGIPAAPVPLGLRDLQHQGHLEERRHPRLRGVHRLRHPPLLHPQPDPAPAPLLLLAPGAGGHRGGRLPVRVPDGRALRAPRHPPALHRPHRHLLPPAAGPHPVPAGAHCADPVRGGHGRLPRRHHAQHLLCRRGSPHRDQGRRAGPGRGGQFRGQGRGAHHRHPQQPRLLPAPRRVRLLRHPGRAQHHVTAREPGPRPAPVPAGRREPAPPAPVPPPPPRGPPAPAGPPRHPPRLFPPGRLHQEDAALPGPPPRDVAVPPPCSPGVSVLLGGLSRVLGPPARDVLGAAGHLGRPGWGSPRWGRILPQEQRCWEAGGGGEAPPGGAAGSQ